MVSAAEQTEEGLWEITKQDQRRDSWEQAQVNGAVGD